MPHSAPGDGDERATRRFFLALAVVLGALAVYTVLPFLNLIVASAFLAYIFNPLERALTRRLGSRSASALLVAVLISLAALAAVVYSAFILQAALASFSSLVERGMPRLEKAEEAYRSVLQRHGIDLRQEVESAVKGAMDSAKGVVLQMLLGLPELALTGLLLIFLTYYFLTDGEALLGQLVELLPCPRRDAVRGLIADTDRLARGIIFGHIAVSLLIGAASYPGYLLIGVGDPIAYAFITTVVALLPIVGGNLVPAALGLYHLARWEAGTGVAMLGLSLFLTVFSQFAYAWVSRRTAAQLHPGLIIIGMISGPFVFGVAGFFVGPIVLGAFMNVLRAYREALGPAGGEGAGAEGGEGADALEAGAPIPGAGAAAPGKGPRRRSAG